MTVKVGVDIPTRILVLRIDLVAGEDREVVEPYHVAGGWEGLKLFNNLQISYPWAIPGL